MNALAELQAWANRDRDRYFEIRFVAEAVSPWAVELANDALSWSVVADAMDDFETAVRIALGKAKEEEASV